MEKEDNHMKCLYCGEDLVWDSDEHANVMSSDYEGDDVATVHFMHCSHCGRSYEVIDPVKEEREGNYAGYWSKNG